MWYLLVAAGAGILAQQWQNTHKGQRVLMSGSRQAQVASPPASAPGSPHADFTSMNFSNDLDMMGHLPFAVDGGIMEKDDAFVNPKVNGGIVEKDDAFVDPKASVGVGGTVKGSSMDVKGGKAGCVSGRTKEGPSIDPKSTFVMGNSNSNLSDHMGYESQQGLSHDKFVSSPMKSNKRSAHEAFIHSDVLMPMEGSVNIALANIKTAVEHAEEPSSPSSCCSSSSTVVNSPLGDPGTIFQEQKGGFDVSEHPQELQTYGGGGYDKLGLVNKAENDGVGFNESCYECFVGTLSKRTPSSCVSHGVKDGGMASWASQFSSSMPSTGQTSTNVNVVADASTQVPYHFTGKTQEGSSKTAFYGSNAFYSGKHSTLELATETSASKVKSSSPTHRVAAVENVADPESDSLSFGLAMGVFLMVSSSKREMEKMGKVLKETEDLVSDMRKELEVRKAHSSCMSSLHVGEASNGVISAGKKDAQKCVRNDDESIGSVVVEDHVRMHDLEAELEVELQLINTYSQASSTALEQLNWKDHSNGYGSREFSRDHEVSSTFEQVGENDLVVSTIDLERKLWKIFQERQEEKIRELEEALELALSKLWAKDEELHWWKNRASWLMQHTFGSRTGENERLEGFGDLNHTNKARYGDEAHEGDEQILYKGTGAEIGSLVVGSGGNEVCHKNSAGHGHGLVRVGSSCSLSSEESVLSYDVRTFTYPDYKDLDKDS